MTTGIEWFPSTANPTILRTSDPRWRLSFCETPPPGATSGPGWYLSGPRADNLFMGRDQRDAEPYASVVVRNICLSLAGHVDAPAPE